MYLHLFFINNVQVIIYNRYQICKTELQQIGNGAMQLYKL